jgi:hypothetical protein
MIRAFLDVALAFIVLIALAWLLSRWIADYFGGMD